MRGTFANIRLRNQIAPGTEGGVTLYLPGGEQMSIYDAAMQYQAGGRAADGHRRQGVRLGLVARLGGQGHAAARRARGDRRELRAHPPQQPRQHGRAAAAVQGRRQRGQPRAHGSRGRSTSRSRRSKPRGELSITARAEDGAAKTFTVRVRVDTPEELDGVPARRHPAVRGAAARDEGVAPGELGRRRPTRAAVDAGACWDMPHSARRSAIAALPCSPLTPSATTP